MNRIGSEPLNVKCDACRQPHCSGKMTRIYQAGPLPGRRRRMVDQVNQSVDLIMRHRGDVAEAVAVGRFREWPGLLRSILLCHRAQIAPIRLRTTNLGLLAGNRVMGNVREIVDRSRSVDGQTEEGGSNGGSDKCHVCIS